MKITNGIACLILALFPCICLSYDQSENFAQNTPDNEKSDFRKEIWIPEDNFLNPPNYMDKVELTSRPASSQCVNELCNSVVVDQKQYYRATAIDSLNYKKYLVGKWTGGDCLTDFWIARENNTFRSQYPDENGLYAWQGNYEFVDHVYHEIGVNSKSNTPENSKAYLYMAID